MSPDAVFEVVDPGLLTTIQARGRPDAADLGVPVGGALDPASLQLAVRLAGGPVDAAALECTVVGPRLRALRDVVVALAGADLGAVVRPSGRRVLPGRTHRLTRGEILDLSAGPARPDAVRAYLAIPGGFDAPVVLGSRATSLPGAFGGLDGRALRAGDRLIAEDAGAAAARAPYRVAATPADGGPLRILPGPSGVAVAEPESAARALASVVWRVTRDADRRGLRLEPADGGSGGLPGSDAEMPSHPVLPGVIQLPPGGGPLVLLADAGTTGGYPVVGVVVAADLPRAGQLGPGATVTFQVVGPEAARAAAAHPRPAVEALEPPADDDPWDDLSQHAGG